MRFRVSVHLAVIGLAWLAACGGGDGNTAPTFEFENLAVAQQVHEGDTVQIMCFEDDADGPNGVATSSFVADMDGDLTTQGDQVAIELDRPCNFGVHQVLNWDTENVPTGVYHVISVMHDDVFVVETTAAGTVTVVDFQITEPAVNRWALTGALIDIAYRYNDPDSAPTTDVYADRDGDLTTVADQYVIAENRVENGGVQNLSWDLAGVDPGTYSIILVNDDGLQGTEQFTAPGRISVVAVTAFAPADGTVLPSTAYNARITFSESVDNVGAVINASTIRVMNDGVIVPGSYTLEGAGREISFEPSAGLFPAGADITITVRTDMLYTAGPAVTSALAEFSTSRSLVFVTGRSSGDIAVMSLDDPTDPVQVGALPLEEGDQPYFSLCASDGLLYISQRYGNPQAGVIVYDVLDMERVGTIPLPPMFGENPVGACGLALSPDEKTLYCAGWEDDLSIEWPQMPRRPFLSVIDRATMTETRRIQMHSAGWPRGIAVSPDGTRVYIANPFGGDYRAVMQGGLEVPIPILGMIHVVSTVTNTEIDTDGVEGNGISPLMPEWGFVVGVAVSGDGNTLYASHGGSEFVEEETGMRFTTNISTFDTRTFVEGMPLFSVAGDIYTAGAPNILFDRQRELLYAPRVNIGANGHADGLSVFQPFVPAEMIVDTSAVEGNNWTMRDVDLLWGTDFVVLADNWFGIVVVDVDAMEAISSASSDNSAKDLATIPPRRH